MNGLQVAHDAVSTSAIVTATAAIFVFVLTQIANMIFGWRKSVNSKRRIVRGLYKEIGDNVTQLSKFAHDTAQRDAVMAKLMADDKFIPMIIVNESSLFHDAMAGYLPFLTTTCMMALSDHYNDLRDYRAITEALSRPAFLTISQGGRASLMNDLWHVFQLAEAHGRGALKALRAEYPRWLREFKP